MASRHSDIGRGGARLCCGDISNYVLRDSDKLWMEWRAEQSRRPRDSLDKVMIGENSSRVDGKNLSFEMYFHFCNLKYW